jgi:hypothetical protein
VNTCFDERILTLGDPESSAPLRHIETWHQRPRIGRRCRCQKIPLGSTTLSLYRPEPVQPENKRPAEHRTILVVDVEDFTDPRRSNKHQIAIRKALYGTLQQACEDANIPWDSCQKEDRGDSIYILAPATIPKARFVDDLPSTLAVALRDHNKACEDEVRIRLRMALNAGEVEFDENGSTSTAVNHTFRLIDSVYLKRALKDSPGVLALVVSDWFFHDVVRHSDHVNPNTFRRIVMSRADPGRFGWISTPDYPYPSRPEATNATSTTKRLFRSLLERVLRRRS